MNQPIAMFFDRLIVNKWKISIFMGNKKMGGIFRFLSK